MADVLSWVVIACILAVAFIVAEILHDLIERYL